MGAGTGLQAVSDARQIGQAASLMYALVITSLPLILSGSYTAAAPNLDEALVLADEQAP